MVGAALLFGLLISLAGCAAPGDSTAPAPAGALRVYSSLPSKGIYKRETELTRHAIDAALTSRAGSTGPSIEHVALEGGSEETGEWAAGIEESNARKAAGDPAAIAYVGPHNSGAAAVALPITSRAGVLQSSPSATWPGLTNAGWDAGEPTRYFGSSPRNFLRLVPPDSYQARAAAEWAKSDGRSRILVLYDGSTYSAGLAREFEASFEGAVAQPVVLDTSVEPITLPPLEGYDAAFIAPSSVQSAARAARALNASALPVYSTDVALEPQLLDLAGDAATSWRIVSNSGATIAAPITTLYTGIPQEFASSRAALTAYVFTRLVVDAVEAGATVREQVLTSVKNARLPDGNAVFDEAGDPTHWTMTGYRAYGKNFEVVREFNP